LSTKNVTIRIDEDLKEASERLFEALGFNMTTAITTFIKQAVREQRIPFDITLNTPNMQTIQAILESEALLSDKATERFTNMEDLVKDLEDDEV